MGPLDMLKMLKVMRMMRAMRKYWKISMQDYASRFNDPFLRKAFLLILEPPPDFLSSLYRLINCCSGRRQAAPLRFNVRPKKRMKRRKQTMTSNNFNWEKAKQLSVIQLLLVFALPSVFAFVGFRLVLPMLVKSGTPVLIAWPSVASVMLLGLVIVAFILL